MLFGPLCWFLGTLLLAGGVMASLYLAWLQVRRGVTGFSLLATSDALATVAISITFLLNASDSHSDTRRIATTTGQCNARDLALVSALFLAPFINTFVSMLAHSAESSRTAEMGPNAPHGRRVRISPRVASSIVAQWLIPTVSALLLLSANVQHSHSPLYRSDSETCLPSMIPMSVETTAQCVQEDISSYITSIMNNPNYSVTHNKAAINKYKKGALNNTDAISNETSVIIDKIYNIVLGSLTSLNQSETRKNYDFPPFFTVSTSRQRRSVGDNKKAFRQFSNTQDKSADNNHYDRQDDPPYYSTSNEDDGNNDDKVTFEYPNYEASDAGVSNAPGQTLYHDLNTNDKDTNEPIRTSLLSTHEHQHQQFKETNKTNEMVDFADTVISSSPSPASQQTGSNSPPVESSISPATTSHSLLTENEEDTAAPSVMEESIMSVTDGLESSNSSLLPTEETPATSQTSAVSEQLSTVSNEFPFQEGSMESAASSSIKPSTESQIIEQPDGSLIHEQNQPDTVNLCVVKCHFSGSFLKKYLFVLLFLCYFIPVLASMVTCAATDKNLTMLQSLQVKPNEVPSTTAEQKDAMETACNNMHLQRMVSTSKTVKHFITTSTLLWTPTFVETLLRVWFCVNTPEWLTTLLFILGQANTIIRNALNVRLIRSHACSGTVQPLQVEQGKTNSNIPTKLFTKVKAVFIQ